MRYAQNILALRASSLSTSHRTAVTLAFNRYGTDNDRQNLPLVIGHGLFGQKQNWNSVSKALQKRLGNQIYAIDFRNHGDSPHTSTHKYPELSEDLAKFIEKEVLKGTDFKRVNLLGHSMGGKVVAEFATDPEFHKLLDKLIIEDVSPAKPNKSANESVFPSYLQAMKSANLSQSRKEIGQELAKTVTDAPVREFLLTNLAYDESNPKVMKWKLNLNTLDREIGHIFSYGLSSGSFPGKTLFISGGNSNYITEKDHPGILKLFPNAVFESIPKAGHWVHAEQPALFIDAIVKFLQE